MDDQEFKQKVMFKLGGIEQHLKSINGKLVAHDDFVKDTEKKLNKYDTILAKAGMIMIAGIFALTAGVNIFIDWIKGLLHING